MEFAAFRATLAELSPPSGISPALRALWLAARDDWSGAHEIAQRDPTPAGAWAHAYLHRGEGDLDNAAYWYRRAGKPLATGALDAEWEEIVADLLSAR